MGGCNAGKAAAPQAATKKGAAPGTLLAGPQGESKVAVKQDVGKDVGIDNVQKHQDNVQEHQLEGDVTEPEKAQVTGVVAEPADLEMALTTCAEEVARTEHGMELQVQDLLQAGNDVSATQEYALDGPVDQNREDREESQVEPPTEELVLKNSEPEP